MCHVAGFPISRIREILLRHSFFFGILLIAPVARFVLLVESQTQLRSNGMDRSRNPIAPAPMRVCNKTAAGPQDVPDPLCGSASETDAFPSLAVGDVVS